MTYDEMTPEEQQRFDDQVFLAQIKVLIEMAEAAQHADKLAEAELCQLARVVN
jgi:hypothetical protein